MGERYVKKRNELIGKKAEKPIIVSMFVIAIITLFVNPVNAAALYSFILVIIQTACIMVSAKYTCMIPIEKKSIVKAEYKQNLKIILNTVVYAVIVSISLSLLRGTFDVSVVINSAIVAYITGSIFPVVFLSYTYAFTELKAKIAMFLYIIAIVSVCLLFLGVFVLALINFIHGVATTENFDNFIQNFGKKPLFGGNPLLKEAIFNKFFENIPVLNNIYIPVIAFTLTLMLHIISYFSSIKNCNCHTKNLFSFLLSKN